MLDRIYRFFSHPWVLSGLNLLLVAGAYVANRAVQAFCMPVTWAAVVLVVTLVPVVFWPLLQRHWPKAAPWLQFLRGIAACICLYCIVFLERNNLLLPLVMATVVGVVAAAPHLLLFQMLFHTFIRKVDRVQRAAFLAGVALSVLVAGLVMLEWRATMADAGRWEAAEGPYEGSHGLFMERMAGMHFKYHTRELTGIDGWRPPLHDPIVVLGCWATGWADPFPRQLSSRIALYRRLFPGSSPQAQCTCAWNHDGRSYLGDPVFLVDAGP